MDMFIFARSTRGHLPGALFSLSDPIAADLDTFSTAERSCSLTKRNTFFCYTQRVSSWAVWQRAQKVSFDWNLEWGKLTAARITGAWLSQSPIQWHVVEFIPLFPFSLKLTIGNNNKQEVAKTRLQLDGELASAKNAPKVYNNSLDVLRKTVKFEGIRGIQRGLGAAYAYQITLLARAFLLSANGLGDLTSGGPGW
jgi:hypothetical protein